MNEGKCPSCETAAKLLHAQVPDLEHGLPVNVDLFRCETCHLVFQFPLPSHETLASYYPQDYRLHVVTKGKPSFFDRLKEIQTAGLIGKCLPFLPAKEGRILELGCGSGKFLLGLEKQGFRNLTGVDQNPALGTIFDNAAIQYVNGSLEKELDLDPPYDCVVMHAVIEHMLEPARLLERCHEWLAPGGSVIIRTPNADSLCHKVFGRYWAGLHAPRHTRIFSPSNLTSLASKAGLEPPQWISIEDPSGWAFSLQNMIVARRASEAYQAATAWYSLLLMPLCFPFSITESLMGKPSMLFCALKKPAA